MVFNGSEREVTSFRKLKISEFRNNVNSIKFKPTLNLSFLFLISLS